MIDYQIRKSQVNPPIKQNKKSISKIQTTHNIPMATLTMHANLLFMSYQIQYFWGFMYQARRSLTPCGR
jgi:hypothetical protein